MSYFATLIYTAFRTRPEPTAIELDRHARLRGELGAARRWIAVACGAVFVQLLLGALVRHLGAAMVCLGMPSCTRPATGGPTSAVQDLHMIHRGFGVVVAIVDHGRRRRRLPPRAVVAALRAARADRAGAGRRRSSRSACYTVLTLRAVPLAVGHFAGAASLWALWMSAWLHDRAARAGARASRRTVPCSARWAHDVHAWPAAVTRRLAPVADLVALVKPRIMMMALLTAAGAMSLAPGAIAPGRALWLIAGTALIVGSANTLNMWLERDIDCLMARTQNRPLPMHRLDAAHRAGVRRAAGRAVAAGARAGQPRSPRRWGSSRWCSTSACTRR